MNILFHPATVVPWPAVPFYGWRLTHAEWRNLEPAKGHWDFSLLDKYVTWSQRHGVSILMILESTPTWASRTPDTESDWGPGGSGVLQDMNDWRNMVRTIALRYKGRIHDYEIWNEPNRPQNWIGDVDAMIAMTREASRILKEIDPTITVCAPAPQEEKGLPWLNEFLRKGGARYVDVIGYHFYVGASPPEAMVPLIQRVRSTMLRNDVDKPLWNTEAGWHEPRPFASQELAAGYVARAYLLNWAAGISRFYWYAWDNHNWTSLEMTERDNVTLRRGGAAYGTIQRWISGAVMTQCVEQENGAWVCELTRGRKPFHIAWSPSGDQPFAVPSQWHATHVTELAGTTRLIAGNVTIGIRPAIFQ